MTKILALIDGSAYAQSVCDLAAWAATRTFAEVEFLHVLGRRETASTPIDLSGNLDADERDELLRELASLDEQKAKLALRRGRVLLDDAKARLEAAGVQKVSTKLRHGDLVETVVEFEADADLVVMGKRGEAADFAKGHLGSNLERVGRSSRKPLLVAARAYNPIQRFLVAYDGGPSAEKAIDYMVRSPLLHGAECELLTVGGEGERGCLDAAAARLREAGFAVQATLAPGHADDVIGNRMNLGGIDLLVMGAYGHSRIRSLIVGSTTAAMVRRCRIPVLMFR
ncbi:universal stress protein [Microvirga makkahensis]|uniref:Universal stress protein n=1 Tax=Microvirga makkahensis TaxID=1128670 RepID=A0A7X3MXI1_9HYPH|nr:universal stress protein [Microvirga makkahensis]MXQ14863.1 universal stress protein [Microvirga makkahensis]